MKVAQILYDKAHWIFETDDTMEQLRSRFAPNIVFVDVTDNTEVKEGWNYNAADGAFMEPAATKDMINAIYLPQFEALKQAYTAAQLVGDTVSATAIQSDYQALITEYNTTMEEVNNG